MRVTEAVFVGGAAVGTQLLLASARVPGGGDIQWLFSSPLNGDSSTNAVLNAKMARGLLWVPH